MSARPFLKTRFRLVPGLADEGDHWLGGEPFHANAICPVCNIPLLQLLDINCRDSRFPPGKFGPLTRLPLYFCWGCVSGLEYQLLPNGELRMLRTEVMREGPSFQYEPYPSHFERRPISLICGMSEEVLAVASKWNREEDPRGHTLSASDHTVLQGYFGHPISTSMSLFHSQIGGPPSQHWWGEEQTPCFNKACPGSVLSKLRLRKPNMSFLAGVLNDPLGGLPMVERPEEVSERWWNFFVSVEFRICGKCWTISGRNRSD